MAGTSRRGFLRTSAAAGAALGVGLSTTPQANADERAVTFVLVHSANASAAWWSDVVRELTYAGHRAIAVDLPGHGPDAYYPVAYQQQDLQRLRTERSPAADVNVDSYAKTVADAVRRARDAGDVVLVGHGDAGAAAITRVANDDPDAVRHLVYTAAYLCVERPTIGEYLELPENSDALLAPPVRTPPELGIARVNWRAVDEKTLTAFRKALVGDMSDDGFRATLNSLSPDVGAALWGEDIQVDARTWGTIPRTYIRFTDDKTIPVPLQDLMVAEADALTPDNRFDVHDVALPHVGPLGHPAIVDVLRRLAR